jgi:hypothetical protein
VCEEEFFLAKAFLFSLLLGVFNLFLAAPAPVEF